MGQEEHFCWKQTDLDYLITRGPQGCGTAVPHLGNGEDDNTDSPQVADRVCVHTAACRSTSCVTVRVCVHTAACRGTSHVTVRVCVHATACHSTSHLTVRVCVHTTACCGTSPVTMRTLLNSSAPWPPRLGNGNNKSAHLPHRAAGKGTWLEQCLTCIVLQMSDTAAPHAPVRGLGRVQLAWPWAWLVI